MLFAELVDAAGRVASTSKRLQKIGILGELLAKMSAQEVAIAGAFLTGGPRQGRIGIGPALLHQVRPAAAGAASLTIDEVDASLGAIAAVSGGGSGTARAEMLGALLGRATEAEQDFLRRLLFGELRQGALEGVVAEAVAKAAGIPAAAVRRALMVSGSLGEVAAAAIHGGGERALSALGVELFRPLQPMLAQTAATVSEALSLLGEASLEAKLDGARVQVHKSGSEVRVFSRRLNDVTVAVPEVVEAVSALPARELILDGEVIALRGDGTPHPFQVTMRRFGRKLDVDGLRGELPLSPFFFDCLWLDGASLLGAPQRERAVALAGLLPPELRVERLVTADAAAAEEFLRATLARGHEGVMAKGLDSPYEAGSRGASWLKIKQAKTLDLVILAVEWGSGRRQGWLSNLHLGARDPEGTIVDATYPEAPGWVMLGKTFKGLTDEMLTWQTERLLALETRRERHVVFVRPEVVVEIAYNDLQESSTYPGGLALRFARVKGYRHDKAPQDADTIATVREAYTRATGLPAP
ncbi:MAG TPA: ATP-dependent DNA ligase [Thermoanaerobaculia bacterium]|nr:ATP-dependent DNA ligase [Thermoanaerobaculia bacterium]